MESSISYHFMYIKHLYDLLTHQSIDSIGKHKNISRLVFLQNLEFMYIKTQYLKSSLYLLSFLSPMIDFMNRFIEMHVHAIGS